jgi:hypothetical protein
MKTALLFWSGGKKCAWALREFKGRVTALLTTYDRRTGRVPLHDVPIEWIEQQAKQLRLPLWSIPLPSPCSDERYAEALNPYLVRADVDVVLFGDLTERTCATVSGCGLTVELPLSGRDSRKLANEMIWGGIQAKITGVDPDKLDNSFVGRKFDAELLESLPQGIDPCGANREFHTFAQDPHRLLRR